MPSPSPRSCSCSRPMGRAADDFQMAGGSLGGWLSLCGCPWKRKGVLVVPTKSPLSWVTARWAAIDAGKGWLGAGAVGMLTSTENILSQIWNQQTLTRQQMWKRSQLKSQGSSFCLLLRERKCSKKKEAWLHCDVRCRAQGYCTRQKLLLPVLCVTRNRGLKQVRIY